MAKTVRPVVGSLLDLVAEHWPAILIGVASLAMTWLAALAAFLKPYGAVAWGGVGVATALMLSLVYLVAAYAYRLLVVAKIAVRRAEAATVNPLAGSFSKQRLRLADFFHPFFKPTSAAKFEDCDLFGPASVYVRGSDLLHCFFSGCEVVIAKQDAHAIGLAVFENCVFSRCRFFQVTFFMVKDQYLQFKAQIGGEMPGASTLPVISDGIAGDL